ncbi:hypothetical protein [Actinoplanes sp. ATCC 53533]|uniref:hypothetical protein n=1 Tax=Actinoplanes sp. ATCC 53533 TaxID=1288362 RepID=UPI000F7A8609|nr:hypothetical protein [Actinoplanes sp. ATCC 53533]
MRRLLPTAIAATAALMSLSSCYLGPDPVQYAALAVVDGRPTAVVAVCGRPEIGVDVHRDDNTDDNDLRIWSVTVTLPHQVRDVEVELLGAARPGWEITSRDGEIADTGLGAIKVVQLTSFEAGHRYRLDSSKSGPEGTKAPAVSFTTADLTGIGPGQVLAAVDRDDAEVVSRDAFVKDSCG